MGLLDLGPVKEMVKPFHEITAEMHSSMSDMGGKLDEVLTEIKTTNKLLKAILDKK